MTCYVVSLKKSLINSRAQSVKDVSECDHSAVNPPVIPATTNSSGYKLGFAREATHSCSFHVNKNVACVCSSPRFHL